MMRTASDTRDDACGIVIEEPRLGVVNTSIPGFRVQHLRMAGRMPVLAENGDGSVLNSPGYEYEQGVDGRLRHPANVVHNHGR